MQKRWMSAVAAAAVCGVAVAQMSAPMAQPGPAPVAGPAGEVQRGYAGQKGNILKAADEMPAADYLSMPTPGIRTYARVVNHITEAQTASCGAVNGNTNLPKVPADTADKAVIVATMAKPGTILRRPLGAKTVFGVEAELPKVPVGKAKKRQTLRQNAKAEREKAAKALAELDQSYRRRLAALHEELHGVQNQIRQVSREWKDRRKSLPAAHRLKPRR